MEVRLEYTLNARDIFRASIGLAKYRILLGLGFSLSLVAGLIILFAMIDEVPILLKTAPLFIGIPLLAVGGQVLRLHAASRKYIASLPAPQRLNRLILSDMNNGLDVVSGESTSHISWNDIQRVTEKRDVFLVYLNKYDIRLIPKVAFRDVAQLEALRSILTAKLDSRARLLS